MLGDPEKKKILKRNFEVEVHEEHFFAQKIEKYVKFNRPKGFSILRIFSKLLRIFKTLKNKISEKKSKMYMEESVENIFD